MKLEDALKKRIQDLVVQRNRLQHDYISVTGALSEAEMWLKLIQAPETDVSQPIESTNRATESNQDQ
jgi:hypothetical protein